MKGDGFDAWYGIYPRKVAKAESRKAFGKLSEQQSALLKKNMPAWNAEFTTRPSDKIPYPATFIRSLAWEDEPPPVVNPKSEAKKPQLTREL